MNWQPIETAPKDGKRVLLFDCWERSEPHAIFVGMFAVEPHHKRWIAIPGCFNKKPTHWMPLPEAP